MNNRRIEALRETILSERSCGEVFLFVDELAGETASTTGRPPLDEFVERHGFKGIGGNWHEVSRQFAEGTLVWILGRDLAYGASIMNPRRAEGLAREFLAFFDDHARFFTNYAVREDEKAVMDRRASYAWAPLTEATFDAGIVVVDARLMGMLWVADED